MYAVAQHGRELKLARHAPGYVHRDPATGISTPVTAITHPDRFRSGSLPAEALAVLKAAAAELLPPSQAERPFDRTRMCWYHDTCVAVLLLSSQRSTPPPHPVVGELALTNPRSTGDYIVTHHPHRTGLFLATGGNGHAFKFLPVLGPHIVDILLLLPGARFSAKWGWPDAPPASAAMSVMNRDGSRCEGGLMDLEM